MVYLEYVGEFDDELVYDFMPEKKNAPKGRVSVNWTTRERKLIKLSPASELDWYHVHAWKRIEQMMDDGDLELSTYAAWY